MFAELRKRQARTSGSWEVFFWRDRQREVDFVVHAGGRFQLLEAKWTEHPSVRDAANLVHLGGILGARHVTSASVVGRTRSAYPLALAGEAPLRSVAVVPIEGEGAPGS